MQASDWAANASLSSMTSRSATVSPARSSALRVDTTGPIPMISGRQPEIAMLLIRASGTSPLRLAYSSEQIRVAEAPSVTGDEVPAVTVPLSSNASFSLASPSSVVSERMQPSSETVPPYQAIGTISSASLPAAWAAAAFCWERSENSS